MPEAVVFPGATEEVAATEETTDEAAPAQEAIATAEVDGGATG